PSGRAWEESTNRRRDRIASTIDPISGLVVIGIRMRAAGAVRGVDLVEELLDSILAGDRFIVEELELGHALQPQPRADLPPQKRRGALEGAGGVPARRVVAERRVRHAGVLQVRRHRDARDGDEPDAGIVDVAREQLRDLAADLIADARGP